MPQHGGAVMSVMTGETLTPEAKEAIRNYMLKFVIPSGVLLTIVSGALGYVVSGLARIDATNEAVKSMSEVQKYAIGAAGAAGEAKASAAAAAAEVARSQTKASDTASYLLTVKDQVDKVLTGQYEGLAKTLFGIKAFRDSIQTIPQQEISEINAKFGEIDKILFGASDTPVPAPGNACPLGTYAVNVGSVSVSGGTHGFLESVSVACKPLRFDRPK
jgi:hypothetical protein